LFTQMERISHPSCCVTCPSKTTSLLVFEVLSWESWAWLCSLPSQPLFGSTSIEHTEYCKRHSHTFSTFWSLAQLCPYPRSCLTISFHESYGWSEQALSRA
jgi:hypothetical protein